MSGTGEAMSELNRRNIIVGGAALPALTLPALADNAVLSSVRVPDPIFAALANWRVLSDHYWSLDDIPDDEMNAACAAESAAALRALTTVPTTVQGLRAFCEFGETISIAEHGRDGGLINWTPGYALPGSHDDAEALFMNTLAKAARSLVPG